MLVLAAGCTQPEPQVSLAYDPQLMTRLVTENAGWPPLCARDPAERLGVPLLLHSESGYRPVPPAFVKDLLRVVKGLPRPFARLFERHVCAVILMHGAPMTGTLMPLAQESTRSIIMLDVDKLSLSPNEWLAFKESTAFQTAPNRVIRGKMAEPGENVRRVLLEFVLVHELGHVVDAAFPDHQLINDFKKVSWPRQDALARTPLLHYPERRSTPPLPDQHLDAYYALIGAGAFASPAAVSNAREDFADSLATFTHTVMRGRPWELEVHRDDQLVRKLTPCWAEPRCREKRAILEALIRRWEDP